jgi:hypothetical protein
MKIYLAGERKPFPATARRRLLTYWYHKDAADIDNELGANAPKDLFLDSGAYTAWTQGIAIEPLNYAKFVHATRNKWSVISNLDVIRDPEKTYKNQKLLETMGVKPCPVFHTKEDLKWLHRYIDEGYDYILMGGIAKGGSLPTIREWLDRAWRNCLLDKDGKPKVKVHGFGLTAQSLIQRYPWHSVDSTAWLVQSNYGKCLIPLDGKIHSIAFSDKSPSQDEWGQNFEGQHFDTLVKPAQKRISDVLAQLGLTVEQVRAHYSSRDVVNAWAYSWSEQNQKYESAVLQRQLF